MEEMNVMRVSLEEKWTVQLVSIIIASSLFQAIHSLSSSLPPSHLSIFMPTLLSVCSFHERRDGEKVLEFFE